MESLKQLVNRPNKEILQDFDIEWKVLKYILNNWEVDYFKSQTVEFKVLYKFDSEINLVLRPGDSEINHKILDTIINSEFNNFCECRYGEFDEYELRIRLFNDRKVYLAIENGDIEENNNGWLWI